MSPPEAVPAIDPDEFRSAFDLFVHAAARSIPTRNPADKTYLTTNEHDEVARLRLAET